MWLLVLMLTAFVLLLLLSVAAVTGNVIELNTTAARIFPDGFPEDIKWILLCALCLSIVIGPFQFSVSVFRRNQPIHFLAGNIYVLMVLLIAAPLMVLLALSQQSIHLMVSANIAAVICWVSTRKSVRLVAAGDLPGHAMWIFRSYAWLLAGSMFKVVILGDFNASITTTAYSFAGVAVVCAELLIQKKQHHALLRRFMYRT